MAANDPVYDQYDPGWKTNAAPFDARFPHTNQAVNCLRNYLDYHRCRKIKGEDYVNCNYFKKVYMRKCHMWQIEKWEDQRGQGILPYQL